MIRTSKKKKSHLDPIVIDVPRKKRRIGVLPTRYERNKSKDIPREEKHKSIPEAD